MNEHLPNQLVAALGKERFELWATLDPIADGAVRVHGFREGYGEGVKLICLFTSMAAGLIVQKSKPAFIQ